MDTIINPIAKVDQSFYFIIGFSFVFLFFVTFVMIYFVIKYRRSHHPDPVDIRGNFLLEVVWVVIPTFIAIAMFISGWQSYTGLRNIPKNTLEVSVIAQSFSWIFVYPDGKESENIMVVPQNKPVKLNITSDDVLHSLFIPAFRVKIDALKAMKTYAWFLPEKIGEFDILCTEYCGVGHFEMTGKVKVVSSLEYEEWINQEDEW